MTTPISAIIDMMDPAVLDDASIVSSAASAAGLVDILPDAGSFGVFVPRDEGLIRGSAERLTELLHDEDALIRVLTSHGHGEDEAGHPIPA